VAQVTVTNKPPAALVRIYRDGRRIGTTGHTKFSVRLSVRHLKRGVHRLLLRVRGADGKVHSWVLRFRRC
jgi:hypothetical protein